MNCLTNVVNNCMKIFTIIIFTCIFVSCSYNKLVKSYKTPQIDNSNIHVVVPMSIKPAPITNNNTSVASQKTHPSSVKYTDTNMVAVILGLIVMLLAFLPLVLMYISLSIEYIGDIISKIYNRYK